MESYKLPQQFEVWFDKYRPKTLDEYIGQDFLKEKLKEFVETGNIPNLMLHSPIAGTGKTTAALMKHQVWNVASFNKFFQFLF